MPTAMIIDDNPTNIRVLEQLLSIEGVIAVTLSNTSDIASQLDAIKNIDVVFLDLEMPVLNGYEVAQMIKTHRNFKATKVVAYSVHVSELHSAFRKGFDSFLGKPLDAEAFPEQLERILKGEKVNFLP